MAVYSYIGRDHVFANAQTGNILLVGVSISEGNWRNALQNVDDYIITHRRGFLENGLLYFGVIFSFVFGAVLGNWCSERMGLHAIVVASVLLVVAFAIMFIDRERDLRFRWKVAAPSRRSPASSSVAATRRFSSAPIPIWSSLALPLR